MISLNFSVSLSSFTYPCTYLITVFSLLQGLRKSSDCGRIKRTIVPHSVPHMVQLRKFIVSEDAVFLLLQYAEGECLMLVASASSLLFSSLPSLIHLSHLSALVLDRCLIEMGVCHRPLFGIPGGAALH